MPIHSLRVPLGSVEISKDIITLPGTTLGVVLSCVNVVRGNVHVHSDGIDPPLHLASTSSRKNAATLNSIRNTRDSLLCFLSFMVKEIEEVTEFMTAFNVTFAIKLCASLA